MPSYSISSECELEKAVQKYHARAGEVVVLDAQTSEVLAMANWPFFDPNLPDKKDAQLWRNRTVADSFEPGSTFKVFLMSAAMEEGMVHERDRIYCEGGKCNLVGHTIKDVHPFGWLTMPEVIKFSSNIGAAKIALHVGGERYYRYIQGFGFGSLTDIQLPGEVKGLVRHFRRWRPIDLATTGFGQSIGVTSLQLSSGRRRHCKRRGIQPAHYCSRNSGLHGKSGSRIPFRKSEKGYSKEDSRPDSCYDVSCNSGRRYRSQCGAGGLYGGGKDWNGPGNGSSDEALCFA